MKIGIITFHRAYNYGAVLQAFALMKTLEDKGAEVEFIDYRSKSISEHYKLFPSIQGLKLKNKVNVIIYNLLLFPFKYIRFSRFKKFIFRRLKLSRTQYKNSTDIKWDYYDICVYGSDQIWNMDIIKNDLVYLGETNGILVSKVSYAASMGAQVENEIPIFRRYLKKFNQISVRESSMIDFLQPLTERTIYQVLDPTLLLSENDWNKIEKPINLKDEYVLVYQVYRDDKLLKFAREIAKKLNLRIIELTSDAFLTHDSRKKILASPEEFISYFKNSSFVVTSSFHGLAFSLIYRKNFYALGLQSMNLGLNNRIYSLLHELNLLDRYIIDYIVPCKMMPIDYMPVVERLNELREKSFDYIDKSLNSLS